MKRILLTSVILLVLFSISCGKKSITYSKEDQVDFLNKVYEIINDDEIKYVAYDFRSNKDYEESHIKQFQNFDLEISDTDAFYDHLITNYGENHYVILLTEDNTLINRIKEHYKHVYVFNGSFIDFSRESLMNFIISYGEYDCGC